MLAFLVDDAILGWAAILLKSTPNPELRVLGSYELGHDIFL